VALTDQNVPDELSVSVYSALLNSIWVTSRIQIGRKPGSKRDIGIDIQTVKLTFPNVSGRL
jgi:hypothetical protein